MFGDGKELGTLVMELLLENNMVYIQGLCINDNKVYLKSVIYKQLLAIKNLHNKKKETTDEVQDNTEHKS